MKEFSGLDLQVEEGNEVIIDEGCIFKSSRLIVKGKGNVLKISKSLLYKSLIINVNGNNKKIVINESGKKINNLKIVSIRGDGQVVEIGADFGCGGLEIQMNDGDECLTIGNDCLLSWGIKMRTSDGHSVIDLETDKAINLPRDVSVGNHVWIGEDVKMLKGSIIPDNTVIGSFSIVTKAFTKENTVIAGCPAKVVKENVNWHREMPKKYNARIL